MTDGTINIMWKKKHLVMLLVLYCGFIVFETAENDK